MLKSKAWKAISTYIQTIISFKWKKKKKIFDTIITFVSKAKQMQFPGF